MSSAPDRMEKLQGMLQREPNDAFLLYALALEYKKTGSYRQAVQYLSKALQANALYYAAWQQLGQVHELAGELDKAKAAYLKGIETAHAARDAHAAQEMQAALEMIA